MRSTLLLRKANDNLTVLRKVLDKCLEEAPQYLSKVKLEQRKIVYDKIKHLNKWYTRIIGLDEVKIYQERVTALQNQLLTTQTKRRELNTQLTKIRHEAQEVQSQIQHIDRKEKFDVYCQLINDEREILNMERSVFATFQEYDQAERDLFTAFTNAVRDSQEKQRAQLEYSKYIGLFLSIVGSFLAFVYTFFWKQDLKLYIQEQISSVKPELSKIDNQELLNVVRKLEKELQKNISLQSKWWNSSRQHHLPAIQRSNEGVGDTNQNVISLDVTRAVTYVGAGILGMLVLRIILG